MVSGSSRCRAGPRPCSSAVAWPSQQKSRRCSRTLLWLARPIERWPGVAEGARPRGDGWCGQPYPAEDGRERQITGADVAQTIKSGFGPSPLRGALAAPALGCRGRCAASVVGGVSWCGHWSTDAATGAVELDSLGEDGSTLDFQSSGRTTDRMLDALADWGDDEDPDDRAVGVPPPVCGRCSGNAPG